MRSKGILIDSDTLTKWIINSPGSPPIIRALDIEPDVVMYACFTAEPDLHMTLRFTSSFIAEEHSPEIASSFQERVEAYIEAYFRDTLNVRYASEDMCRRWVALACDEPVHSEANREHLWTIICAQQLRDSRCDVTIAAEEPHIYQAYKDAGFLDEIEILQRV